MNKFEKIGIDQLIDNIVNSKEIIEMAKNIEIGKETIKSIKKNLDEEIKMYKLLMSNFTSLMKKHTDDLIKCEMDDESVEYFKKNLGERLKISNQSND